MKTEQELKEYMKQWRLSNPKYKEWRENNKLALRARSREHYHRNADPAIKIRKEERLKKIQEFEDRMRKAKQEKIQLKIEALVIQKYKFMLRIESIDRQIEFLGGE